ncbi:MAG: RMD1 family protein [Reichenbachiella sp.]|uniref:RMD1 family protein n=1 Tax=Reichenbachiella sp. TaxID=2184521 RepID=UPI0032985C66
MSDSINTLKAFHIQNSINLKECKSTLSSLVIDSSSMDLFLNLGDGKYGRIFNYGVMVFYGCGQEDISKLFMELAIVEDVKALENYSDDFGIKLSDGDYKIDFNYITLPEINEEVIRIAMLNLGQSLALKYYDAVSQDLLSSIREFTGELETKGKLKISQKNILKFVGKALNTQNRIAENLYIFDAPAVTWENEYLEQVNLSLSKHFELSSRYRSIDSTFNIIKDNLSAYLDLYHHKESSKLEWIIIILILVEVIDTFVSKML